MRFDLAGSVLRSEDSEPSPLDAIVSSAGACAHYFAAAILLARRIDPEGLRVVAIAEKSTAPAQSIRKLSLHVTLPASVPAPYLEPIERAIRNCSTLHAMVDSAALTVELQREASAVSPQTRARLDAVCAEP